MGVVSIGNIQAGTAGNIIPEQVAMVGTIRSNHEDIRQTILKDLPVMVEHIGLANNVKTHVDIAQYAPVTSNNKILTESMLPTLNAVVGVQKLHRLDTNASASEDFSYYGQYMPSLFVFLGATPSTIELNKAAPNHNPNFIVDDATLKTGVETHVRFVLDYPNVAQKVQDAWLNKDQNPS